MANGKKSSQGEVAFITGAGQGIGKSIAERLHADGFRVAIADMNDATAQEVAESLGGEKAGAIPVHVDVSSRDSIYAAINHTIEVFGDLHVVANNAGIAPATPVVEVTQEEFDKVLAINIGGVFWGIQAAARAFIRLGHGGKILSASSQAGHVGNPGIAPYSGSKFAVRGMTQAAARELGVFGITVNAWAPGAVRTPMLEPYIHERAKAAGESYEWAAKQWGSDIVIGRLSEPEDVANAVAFLASHDSDYITGQSLIVDGGMAFN